jgi:hypothetical protein
MADSLKLSDYRMCPYCHKVYGGDVDEPTAPLEVATAAVLKGVIELICVDCLLRPDSVTNPK